MMELKKQKSESLTPEMEEFVAKQAEEAKEKQRKSRRNTILFCFGVVIFVLCSKFFISPVSVIGKSMYPTYENGQLLFAKSRLIQAEPEYGDVVVFKNDKTKGSLYIKRLVGKPGDILTIEDGELFRNGELAENFEIMDGGNDKFTSSSFTYIDSNTIELQEGEYLAMGDNRNESLDCRVIGPIAIEDIRYIVFK